MSKFSAFWLLLLFALPVLGQNIENIPLVYDTSGYSGENTSFANRMNSSLNSTYSSSTDTIPAIKSEMNVNDSGALTFMIPIDVMKGLNKFQPNLAIAYNSQSGNGQAGWGWNLVGLSSIMRGGKSKLLDGITLGPQFNDSDPFYLDGQRLIATSSTTFETEKYSKIKITKDNTASLNSGYSFTIQYTDGKVAKYKELVTGQHYISVIKDALDNEIHYTYSITSNVPQISSISYGGSSVSNDKFFINFNYIDRTVHTKTYRNGILFKNTKLLNEVKVQSVYLTANNGLFRKYKLHYDKIQNNTVERLIKVEVENESGQSLKPLNFTYNLATTANLISRDSYNSGLNQNVVALGNVAVGDFYRTGRVFPIYEVKRADSTYTLNVQVNGAMNYLKSREYFVGRTIQNNKICENDQLISLSIDYLGGDNFSSPSNAVNLIDKLKFKFNDLVNGFTKTIELNLPGGVKFHTLPEDPSFTEYLEYYTDNTPYDRDTTGREYLTGDYNNDGLIDMLIVEKSNLSRPLKIYYVELGLLPSGVTTPIPISVPSMIEKSRYYQVEFDGDGANEIMLVSTEEDNDGLCSVFKLNLSTNALLAIPTFQNVPIPDFEERTPLIFGDFNGDGLTDFMTPKKIYSIKGSSASKELKKMETEQQLWWEFMGTGTTYIQTLRNYTQQKLAYMAPSQRNIIKRSSTWSKIWNGTPDRYSHTEYGSSSIIPMDINNDGKTDLVAFRKFGKAKYDSGGKLWKTTLENLNEFVVPGYFNNDLTYVQPETLNSAIANKVIFHVNKTLPTGYHSFEALTSSVDISQKRISPLSLVLNNTDYNQLNTYKPEIFIHDPVSLTDRSYIFSNEEFSEGLLREVNNGSPITLGIEYRPMVEKNNTNHEKVYLTDNLSLLYPYYIHKNIGITYLVHKMHTLFDNNVLTKEYRYQNGIQHLWGKGFIGFQKTYVSDVYESKYINGKYLVKDMFKGLFWNIKTYDPLNDNALVSSIYGSLNLNSVFTKSVITNQRFTKSYNRYLILPTFEQNKDFLQDITINKTYQYDSNGDLLLQQVNTDFNSQASGVETYEYQPESNNGEHYFFGKIIKTEKTSIRDGHTFVVKDEQSFNGNGTLAQIRKYGITSSTLSSIQPVPPIFTDYTYTTFGEIETETLSTSNLATSSGVCSLTTTYEYDSTLRYINKIISPEGMEDIINVNALGRVISETSGLGLTTSYKYDYWGSVKEITDYLGKKTTISKMIDDTAPSGSYIIAKKREGGIETRVLIDKFDREIKSMSQTLNNQWVTKATEYDVFGKKIKVSEPYFSSETPLWNEISYDELDRPIKNISFNGKIVTTCYEKMKVTVDDGNVKTAKWLDATGNTIRHKDSGGEIFYKYYPNGSLKETDYAGIKTKVQIDAWGNKTKLIDPSAGTYLYQYDNLSRIKKETNPRGGITEYTYDDWGRPLTENTVGGNGENTNIQKTFSYDGTTHLPTVISGNYNGKNYTYATFYNDPYHRVTGKKELTPDFNYEVTTSYDDLGRVDTTLLKTTLTSPSYISQSTIKNNYDNNSILISQTDLDNSQIIWEVNSINSHGITTQMTYGNGYVLNSTYNTSTLSLENIKHQKDNFSLIDIDYSYNIQRGVLLNRNNHSFNKNEDYEYDELRRLLEEKVNGIVIQNYTYDQRGRMTSNTAVGKYNYNNQDYKLESINYNANGSQLNSDRGFAQIQYNSFKNPTEIFLDGKDRISYDYSILKTRSASYYGSLSTTPTERPNRKFYSADKTIEIVKEGTTTKIITYITGDPYNANYIKIDQLTGSNVDSVNRYYLHRDNQGTILAITTADQSSTIVEQRYFDAWGNLKNAIVGGVVQTPNTMGWVNTLLIDRGYTGHEHLKTVGLIHMNGRIYDPQLKRFLSPDNFVQDPFNTQSYNRYGYVFNNPLLYTDPSGEIAFLAGVAIIAGVAILTNSIINMINGIPFWYGIGKAGVMGAVSGAISFGIGYAQSCIFNTQAAILTLKEAALSGLGTLIGNFLPQVEVKMGNWSFSLNAAILLGKSNGLGLNLQISYTEGDFNISYGFGLTGYGKYLDTGKRGFEFRNSIMIGYDDGNTGFGIGTNFFDGSGEMKEFKQRTSILNFNKGDFRFSYENDGSPFSYGGKALSNNTDMYRTAAASVGIGDFSMKLNMFTGRSGNDDNCSDCVNYNEGRSKKGNPLGIWDNPQADKYRLGALTIGYKGLNIGLNSEHIRDGFQNWFAHKFISPQPGFRMLDNSINPYFQFQNQNNFTLW